MRFGLVGTSRWAEMAHAPTLGSHPRSTFVGVWGRDSAATQRLAAAHGVTAFARYEDLLESVDVVAFAVPPSAQVPLAVQAAEAGRHLLLEKPVCFSPQEANRLVDVVSQHGVCSMVFFTARFRPEIEQWRQEAETHDWTSAQGSWITSALSSSDTAWSRSAWRWEKGALWDLGPHALSLLMPIMGPTSIAAYLHGRGDLVYVLLQHDDERTSNLVFTLRAPKEATAETLTLWSPAGVTVMPPVITPGREALAHAVTALIDQIAAGSSSHPCDVQFGRDVVHLLAAVDATTQLDAHVHMPR